MLRVIKDLKLIYISIILGCLGSWLARNNFTEFLLNGKSFENRSRLLQTGILLVSAIIFSLFFRFLIEILLKSKNKIVHSQTIIWVRKIFLSLSKAPWSNPILLSATAVYFYVFMEWIFFVTNISFLSNFNIFQKIEAYLIASLILSVPIIALQAITFFCFKIIRFSYWVFAIIPAFIIALQSMILVDNFSYTLYKFGIETSKGWYRLIYLLVLFGFFLYILKYIATFLDKKQKSFPIFLYLPTLFLWVLSWAITLALAPKAIINIYHEATFTQTSEQEPNIILFSLDGVNANNMSVYGYERETTPAIDSFSKTAMIIDNAYPNANVTSASLTSVLTGKHPTITGVINAPNILSGENSYQHLPGILKLHGYKTIQITDTYWADAYTRNLKNGFDEANGKFENPNPCLDVIRQIGNGSGYYFTTIIFERALDRLQHILLIKEMVNPKKVLDAPNNWGDDSRFDQLIDALDKSKEPVFIQTHMLASHGPNFYIKNPVFSAGNAPNQGSLYDDAILQEDNYVKRLFEYLKDSGKINNTIIIIYSDHGKDHSVIERVPLLIWFPNGSYAGRFEENTQLMDIAPTLLDYLKIPKPDWMTGNSLLNNYLPSQNIIFSVREASDTRRAEAGGSPPFYQLGAVTFIVCNQWFNMNVDDTWLTNGTVSGSRNICSDSQIPTSKKAKLIFRQFMKNNGYPVLVFT